MAAQDGVTYTTAYRRRVLRERVSPQCRACEGGDETLGDFLTSYPAHQWSLCKERHDRVLFLLIKAVLNHLGINMPGSLKESEGVVKPGLMGTKEVRLLVDQELATDRPIRHRRPDLAVHLDRERKIVLYEVACMWDPLIKERENEKKRKYQELAADLAKRWQGYKVTVVLVVLGDLGTLRRLDRT